MNSTQRAAMAALCIATAAHVAASELSVLFRAPSFQAACELAGNDGKMVFIDFYTTWCEPCKRLDAQTFSDVGVARLIGDSAVALKLDAEKEGKEVAARYKVTAYPTLLVVRPDGVEVDRIIGFRDPAAFTNDFKKLITLAAAGKTGLEEARHNVVRKPVAQDAGAEPEEAQPHFELARKLVVAGDREEALKELLWCWDEGKKDPEFARSRSMMVPRELGKLARDYPPARQAMLVRRDQARDRANNNKGGSVVVQDLIQLNRELKMDEDTIEVFDRMPAGDRRKVTISIYLFDVFLEKQRYADATLFESLDTSIMQIEHAKM